MKVLATLITLLYTSISCHAFTLNHHHRAVTGVTHFQPPRTMMTMSSEDAGEGEESSNSMTRRKAFQDAAIKTASIVGIASSSSFNFPTLATAATEDEGTTTSDVVPAASKPMGSDASHPISIIGAGGKVGLLCTQILNKQGLYSRAITRSGRNVLGDDDSSSSPSTTTAYASGDVTSYEAIKKAVEGSSGVIFAASASGKKKGGDPEHVDYLGLYNTAKACIECGVPKLVVVSAGSVTRPDFVGFKATNFFVKYVYGDKIMDHKIAGEAVMRDLYANQDKCSYCVVRPGGLSDAQAEGPKNIHVSQGDVYSAEITREDVAEVTVAALLKGAATDFTTFELNQKKGLAKVSKELETPPNELVHDGANSYDALLDGLLTDAQMKSTYPQYSNDFRGDKIKPISEVV